LRGWLDLPLDEQGLQEAEQTAERLAKYSVQTIYSSDLRRARQTAEALRRRAGAPRVITTQELRPWNLGAFCGQLVKELLPFLDLLNQHPEIPAPSGESFYDFYARYSRRLNNLLDLARQSPSCIVAVSHVRNVLAAKTVLENGDPRYVPVSGGPPTGTLLVIEEHNGSWQMRLDDEPLHIDKRAAVSAYVPAEATA